MALALCALCGALIRTEHGFYSGEPVRWIHVAGDHDATPPTDAEQGAVRSR